MSLVLKDRVVETSTTSGTGTFTLSGAQTGYQAFTVIGNGNTTYYTIQGKNSDGTLTGEWEVGLGTYQNGTLTRDTVLSSSNTNNKVAFSIGLKDVFCDLPAELYTNTPMSFVVTGYGAFQNTADQTFLAANTPTKIVVNTTDFIKGMTRSGSTITDITPGLYNLQFSLQVANTDTKIHEITVWLKKNGSDIAGTATKFSITNNHAGIDGYNVPVANFFLSLVPSDTVELWGAVSNTALYIEAYPAQTSPYARPAIPSTVFTLSQVA